MQLSFLSKLPENFVHFPCKHGLEFFGLQHLCGTCVTCDIGHLLLFFPFEIYDHRGNHFLIPQKIVVESIQRWANTVIEESLPVIETEY